MTSRFTLDGSAELELQLASVCSGAAQRIGEAIPGRSLEALLLGGGYGRGEGGVLCTAEGDRPYNDLEFYVLLRGNHFLLRPFGRRVHEIAEELTTKAGVEVELKLLPVQKLTRSEVSMFYYDLVCGHRLVAGTDRWLSSCEHHRAAHRIPLHEATRLLMNRCSGLLFAEERLRRTNFSADDADFVGRNLAKAKLAFGDVVLTMRGQYHWSCRERHKRLKKLAVRSSRENLASILLLHEQGVEFKLHPIRTAKPVGDLRSELTFLKELARDLWLQLESGRLGRTFRSVTEYLLDPKSKCPETNRLKNRLVNARTFGISAGFHSRYPRERLLRSLPALLWQTDQPEFLPMLQEQLRTRVGDFPALVASYESIWRIYN